MPKKIFITGASSNIAKGLLKILPKNTIVYKYTSKNLNMEEIDKIKKIKKKIINSDIIILLHSIIIPKKHLNKSIIEKIKQVKVNLLSIIEICEIALLNNKKTRIFILGSESAKKGSFDIIYSLTKSAIHKYIEERKISFPNQQIVGIAPSTIIDAGMTMRRKDKINIKKSILSNPKKRGLLSFEISKLLYSLIFDNTDYISNTIIEINGGKFSRM